MIICFPSVRHAPYPAGPVSWFLSSASVSTITESCVRSVSASFMLILHFFVVFGEGGRALTHVNHGSSSKRRWKNEKHFRFRVLCCEAPRVKTALLHSCRCKLSVCSCLFSPCVYRKSSLAGWGSRVPPADTCPRGPVKF